MKQFLIALFCIILFASCENENKIQKISKNNFSIELPEFLTETKDLNDDAILQYQNVFKEFYIIIIEDNKAELGKVLSDNQLLSLYPNDLQGFTDLNLTNFEDIKIKKKSKIEDKIINGLPSKLITLNAKIEGMDIFYNLAYIEGKENFYQIMTWTLESEEKKHITKMKQIINSFKEIKGIKHK